MKKATLLILTILALCSCKKSDKNVDFRQEMRNFVIAISNEAKTHKSNFLIIPQNGIELICTEDDSSSSLAASYLEAIDGHGQEDLFYGYDADDRATKSKDTQYLLDYLTRSHNAGNVILVTDYCSTSAKVADSYTKNAQNDFVSFAANSRSLDQIPTTIYNENADKIEKFSQVRNFLYLINPEKYTKKSEFISAVCATNYDLLIMDLFFQDNTTFSADEIEQLRQKANGGKRLVVCYMSIGEAEDYRYYWKNEWKTNRPSWLAKENPAWKGNYKVRYWDPEWQRIIFGTTDSYLTRILNANFDGVYLDIIDAFDYFE